MKQQNGMREKTATKNAASAGARTGIHPRHADTRSMAGEEVRARRGERSKTFALGGGLYQTVLYPEKVHYRDGQGAWREIDNRLRPVGDGGREMENTAGPLRMRLGARADASPLVTMRDQEGHSLRWRLEGALNAPGAPEQPPEQPRQGAQVDADGDQDRGRAYAHKALSTVRYAEALPDTDLICELRGDGLKETLVLKGPGAPRRYGYAFETGDLAWEEAGDGSLRLWDLANPGEDVFLLPAPYMVDAANRRGAVRTRWETREGSLFMTMIPEEAFLEAAEYPVMIDPTVQSGQAVAETGDTYLSETNADASYGGEQTLRLGKHEGFGECKALVRIGDLPALGSAYTIAKAWLVVAALPTTANTKDAYVYAHQVLEPWDPATATWNSKPAWEEKRLDWALVKKGEAEAKAVQLDITNLVRKWYGAPEGNYGLLLEAPGEEPLTLTASENTAYTSSARPVIHVNYVSAAGLEDYLAYESFGVGRAGTAHVALHSGHLAVTRGLTAMNGNRMPVSLGLAWNASAMDQNAFGVGKGWRLSWNRSLRREQPATGDYYYVLTDGDGTEHEFRKHERTTEEQGQSGFVDYYGDRSGLSLKLYEGSAEAEIVGKDHSKLVFDKPTVDYTSANNAVKMVKRALDALGNTAAFEHDASLRLTKATDGAGRETVLSYTASEARIAVPGYETQVVLALDGEGRLTTITDLDGGQSRYEYVGGGDPAARNRLARVRNSVEERWVEPAYDQRGRVERVRVYGMEEPREGEPVPMGMYGAERLEPVELPMEAYGKESPAGPQLPMGMYGKENPQGPQLPMELYGMEEEPLGPEVDMEVYGKKEPVGPELPLVVCGVEWPDGAPFMVEGDARGYEYFDCVTQVRDLTVPDGKVLTYQFNDYGNVVAVHDELGFAAFAKFAGTGKPNTPESVSKLHRLVVNLLDSHDFTADSGWKRGVTGEDGTERQAREPGAMGLELLRLERPAPGETSYAEYARPCEAGEHTFSARVSSDGEAAAWVEMAWQDGEGQWHAAASPKVRRVGVPLTLSCTIDLPEAATVRCRVLTAEGNGWVWFDRAQLERGALPNRHNLLRKANFTALEAGAPPQEWMLAQEGEASGEGSEPPATPALEIAPAADSVNKPKELGSNCLRMLGEPGKKNGLYQELDLWGEKGDNYVVSGWCRAWAAPSGEKRTFRLRVRFQKKTGPWVDGGTAEWNEEWVDWQYACGAAVAPADYRRMQVYIEYDENLNEAQIGAVSLTKEYYGQSFAYDEKNNVTAVSTLLGQKAKAEYDGFDNLVSYVQPGREEGDKYTFFFGDTDEEKKRHLPLRSTTPLGVVTESEYDSFGNVTRSVVRSDGEPEFLEFMESGKTYTEDGNYVTSTTNTRGFATLTQVDPEKGVVLGLTDPMGQRVEYEYDSANRMTETRTEVEGKVYRNTYTYEKDRIKTVSHNTEDGQPDVTYTFEANGLGNQTRVRVNGQTLSNNRYSATGDKLLEAVEYGNGGAVRYTYDSFKRTAGIRYDDATEPRFTYGYGANGALGYVKDAELGREVRMAYDMAERPVEAELYENNVLKYHLTQEYDRFQQPSVLHEWVEGADDTGRGYTVRVEYDKESKPVSVTYESVEAGEVRKLTYAYDGLGRVAKRSFHGGPGSEIPTLESVYTYVPGGHGADSTTPLVQAIEQAGGKYEYWYDTLGNISKESRQGSASDITYAYDPLGQLIRVNDQQKDNTWTYRYDQGGNILEKKRYEYTVTASLTGLTPQQTIPYTYGHENWKDKLTAYDGKAITYDAIGNPLTYDGWAYTWKAGRMLHSMVKCGTTAQFAYDHTGLRVKKSVSGVDTLYTLNGKQITHIRKGPNNASGMDATQMHFFYDAQGRPAMVRYNGVDYAYLHNLQGDIISIVDMDGTLVVQYDYDAWGKPTTTEGSMAGTLGYDNPFRYRGYVWDEETGLYYLRSRYYNPEWGRFLNSDNLLGKVGLLLQHNPFSYCVNSPLLFSDPSGHSFLGELLASFVDQLLFGRVRRLWSAVSLVLRAASYVHSADLLDHANQRESSPLYFNNDSSLAEKIKENDNFRTAFAAQVKAKNFGNVFSVQFSDDIDLFGALNKVDACISLVTVKGIEKYHVSMHDIYDFKYEAEYTTPDGSTMKKVIYPVAIIANNLAWLDMESGGLNSYEINIEFYIEK